MSDRPVNAEELNSIPSL